MVNIINKEGRFHKWCAQAVINRKELKEWECECTLHYGPFFFISNLIWVDRKPSWDPFFNSCLMSKLISRITYMRITCRFINNKRPPVVSTNPISFHRITPPPFYIWSSHPFWYINKKSKSKRIQFIFIIPHFWCVHQWMWGMTHVRSVLKMNWKLSCRHI